MIARTAPPPTRQGLLSGLLSGLLLAVICSAGILAERLAKGDARIVVLADAAAAATAVVILATIFRRFVTPPSSAHERAAPPSPTRLIGAQAVGALLGVALVHVALRRSSLGACGWLCEQPGQLVNDLVGVFGALALVWGCARRPIGALASLGAITIAAAYAYTSSRWHIDPWRSDVLQGSFRSISVQIAVLGQLACTAVGTAVFFRLRTGERRLDLL